jgi:hypothetical protein
MAFSEYCGKQDYTDTSPPSFQRQGSSKKRHNLQFLKGKRESSTNHSLTFKNEGVGCHIIRQR